MRFGRDARQQRVVLEALEEVGDAGMSPNALAVTTQLPEQRLQMILQRLIETGRGRPPRRSAPRRLPHHPLALPHRDGPASPERLTTTHLRTLPERPPAPRPAGVKCSCGVRACLHVGHALRLAADACRHVDLGRGLVHAPLRDVLQSRRDELRGPRRAAPSARRSGRRSAPPRSGRPPRSSRPPPGPCRRCMRSRSRCGCRTGRLAEPGDDVGGQVAPDEVQDGDEQQADRLVEVDDLPDLRVLDDRVGERASCCTVMTPSTVARSARLCAITIGSLST